MGFILICNFLGDVILQIIADLHTHTIASTHAYSTIIENSLCAKEKGLKAIAMTDHAPTMWDAPHIWHFDNLGILPRYLNDVMIIRGVEANVIDFNGNIDVPRYTLDKLEWVVASFHGPCITPGTIEQNTQAYIELSKNPDVDVIGHPSTNEYVWDYEKGLKYIKENGKIIELNESSITERKGAYENAKRMLEICKRLEIPISIDTDAHFCQNVGVIPNATRLIEEVNFPHELIINLDFEKIKAHILSKRPNALQ